MFILLVTAVLAAGRSGRRGGPPQGTSGFDYEAYSRTIDRHVHKGAQLGVPGTVVNYLTMKHDPDYKAAVDSLRRVNMNHLSLNESWALGCNVYNLLSFKMVIDMACRRDEQFRCLGPIFGLDDINDWAHMKIHDLGGELRSLHEIEWWTHPTPSAPLFDMSNGPVKPDVRAHACLICGGVSCPDVRAYTPGNIEYELDAITKSWMANVYKGMKIDESKNTVTWSMIMSWYKDEFDAMGGAEKAMMPYLTETAKAFFAKAKGNYTEEYLGYVWDSNGPVPCDCLPEVTETRAWDVRDHGSPLVPSSHIKEPVDLCTFDTCDKYNCK